jgi:hypothetical protein
MLLWIYAPDKVIPPPQQWEFGGNLVAFCHWILSQPYWEFVGLFILPNYTWKIVGIVRGLSAAILYYFVQWNPQILPFYTMW